jgi:hypothetical protein
MARLVMLIVVAPLSFHFGPKFEKKKKLKTLKKFAALRSNPIFQTLQLHSGKQLPLIKAGPRYAKNAKARRTFGQIL